MKPKAVPYCGALLSVLLVAGACGNDDSNAADDEVIVGVFAPVTGGGAGIGEQAQLGVEYAEQVINEDGGIDGRPVRLVIADDQGDPTAGVSAARRLLTQEDIDVAIGPAYSQVTLAVLPLLTDAGVFSMNITGSEDLTPDVTPYSFGLLVNADSQVEVLVEQAAEAGYSSVAFISDNGPQAQTALEAAETHLRAAGIDLTGSQLYNYDATDMTSQMLDLRNGSPEALIAFTSTGDHSGYILEAREQLSWDVPILGSYGFSLSGPAIEIAGEEAFEGVAGVNYEAFTYCDDMRDEVREFVDGVLEFDSSTASASDLNYVSLWYDALFIIKQAVEANEGSLDSEVLAEWMESGEAVNADVGVNRDLVGSADSHFLISADHLAMVHPEQMLEGGVQRLVSC